MFYDCVCFLLLLPLLLYSEFVVKGLRAESFRSCSSKHVAEGENWGGGCLGPSLLVETCKCYKVLCFMYI